MGDGTLSHIKAEEDYEQRQRDAKKWAELELEMAREQRERREVTPDPASGFRPIDKNNIPPENAIVLVRYVEGRKETHLRNPKLWSSADQQRVFPAQVIYNRVPFSKTETEFRGFMTLAPHCTGTADATTYVDGQVSEAFDGWMPMPS